MDVLSVFAGIAISLVVYFLACTVPDMLAYSRKKDLAKKVRCIDEYSDSILTMSGYVEVRDMRYLKELGCQIISRTLHTVGPDYLNNRISFKTPGGKKTEFVTRNTGQGSSIFLNGW